MRSALLLLAAVGCGADASAPPIVRTQVALVPLAENRAVDLLFLIDNSTNFLDSQTALKAAFPALVNELSHLPGGLPDLHLGVATSDLGAMGALDSEPGAGIGAGPGSCYGTGQDGALQTNGTTLVSGTFISDQANPDGTRTVNYTGTLAQAFNAIASVGSSGCGFEQHLHAAKRALDNNPANAGFLREGAGLAIVVFADEDDCSFAHSSFLSTTDPALGPLASFRCTQFGVLCDGGGATPDDMKVPGVKTSCHANDSSPYIMPVADYVTFFRGLKPDPRNVMVSTIVGDPSPFEVELRTPPGGGLTTQPALSLVCAPREGVDPDPRLAQLPAQFARGSFESLCALDLAPAVTSIGRQIRGLVGDACLTRDIALPADCQVFDQTLAGETELPACDADVTTDCYRLVVDPACTTSQQLRLEATRSLPPPADTMVAARCRL